MKIKFKNSFLGYFQFYYSIVGNKFLINLVLSIIISALDGLGLAMFMPLLSATSNDKIAAGQDSVLIRTFTTVVNFFGFDLTLTTILGFLVLLFTLKGLIKYGQVVYQVNIRQLFIHRVRVYLVDSLRNLSYAGFLKLDSGRIQNTLTSEVQRLLQGFNSYFNAAQSLLMLVTYMGLAFLANYQFAFFVVVGAGLSNFLYQRIYQSTKKASVELSKKGNDFNSFLIQAIHHFKYLKSTNYFAEFSKKLKKVIVDTEKINKKIGLYNAITGSAREPIIIIIVAAVIFIEVRLIGASMSSIAISLVLFYRSLSFLMVIQNYWQSFIQSIGSMDSITNMTMQMDKEQEQQSTKAFSSFNQGIELNSIDFCYGQHKIFEGLNLTIPKNKTVALIGESGSGKTTLANIVATLIKPTGGAVLIDGVDINSYNLDSFRDKIGYISQEPVIFNDNIYNNVTFWAEKTPENEAKFWEAIALASLGDFIKAQAAQENTLLGDNGTLISGGQKQRISIARELYKDAQILILDEATSALDSETEQIIKENIDQLHGNYTMVIIAHRLSTIKEADSIYLLEKGGISASGTFNELIEKSDRFKRMVGMQEV
jgi:ABC-type multidrug transport system fused ATPase/permease subunit